MEKKLQEILEKMNALDNTVMTKTALDAVLASFKKELEDADTAEAKELKSKIESLTQEVASLKALPGTQFHTKADDVDAEEKSREEALKKYLKKGSTALDAAEVKLMTSNDDSTGGYLTGKRIDKQIIKDLREINSMMAVANVITTQSKVYSFVKVLNLSKSGFVAEGSKGVNKDVNFEVIDISTYPCKHSVYITQEDLEDAEIDPVAIVTEQLGEGLAEAAEDAFVIGDGINKPEGFLKDATVLANAVVSSTVGALVDVDLISLTGKIKTKYKKNAVFMANRDMLTEIAKMKDGTGKFIFSTDPLERYPDSYGTLMNKPVYEAPSMANTVATGAIVLAYGDFKKGYAIVERAGTQILRDDLTEAEAGVVKFMGRKRLGGKTVQPEAIAVLKIQ